MIRRIRIHFLVRLFIGHQRPHWTSSNLRHRLLHFSAAFSARDFRTQLLVNSSTLIILFGCSLWSLFYNTLTNRRYVFTFLRVLLFLYLSTNVQYEILNTTHNMKILEFKIFYNFFRKSRFSNTHTQNPKSQKNSKIPNEATTTLWWCFWPSEQGNLGEEEMVYIARASLLSSENVSNKVGYRGTESIHSVADFDTSASDSWEFGTSSTLLKTSLRATHHQQIQTAKIRRFDQSNVTDRYLG